MEDFGNCTIACKHEDCFGLLTKEELTALEKHRITINYRKGETLVKQGSSVNHILFLRSGLAKIYLEGSNKDLILKIIPPDHFIGLSSLKCKDDLYIYSSAVYIDSRVDMIDKDFFVKLIENNSKFALSVISIINEATAVSYRRVYSLTSKQMHGKVADLLVCLSENVFLKDEFNVPISRKDFSELLGISVESVVRVFKEFKDSGLVEISGSNFKLLDIEGLKEISNYG
jgi:CRP/FNR family transcriptional regulator